jgi:hypothetical protein
MQEMNYIHLSRHDYRAIRSSAMLPTLAHEATEHNQPKSDETDGGLAADNHRKQFGREGLGAGSEGLVGKFNSYPT